MLLKKISSNRSQRRGAAVVEFAVCLPVIILIVLGGIEAASMLFLRQTLVQASYEGIKTAVKPGGTDAAAIASATAVCNGRNLRDFSIVVSPSNVENLDRGTVIEVTVSAPGDTNSVFPFGPFAGQNVTATSVMVKE